MAELQKTNEFKIVGRLVDAEVTYGTRKSNGAAFVSTKATIVAEIDDVKNEFVVTFTANQMTSKNEVSKLYTSYTTMPELKGKKVEVSGSMSENRFWSKQGEQMVSRQELRGKFVRGVAETSADDATFVFSGFVAQALTEKKNKKGEIYRYDLTVFQANYDNSAASKFVFNVDPNRMDIVRGVQNTYGVGDTVRINGKLNFTVEQVTSEVKNDGGFGDPIVRTYTNRNSNFFITNGSPVITDDTKYDNAMISDLIAGYKARDVELTDRAKNSTNATPAVETAPVVTKKQTSLI